MQFLYCCELLWATAAIAAAETSANRVATAMPPAQELVFLVGLSIENFQLKPTSPESFRSTSPNRVNTAYPRPYESVSWEGRQQSIRGNANRHSTKRFWWSFIENTHVSLTKHNSAFNKVTQSFDFLMFKRLLVTLFGLAITSPTKANQLV